MALIAKMNFILGNSEYMAGAELPEAKLSAEHIAAMIGCGSAEYREEAEPEPEPVPEKPKAKRKTAKAGRTGIAQPSSGPENDLVGQVPDPEVRGVVKEPAKRPGRKSPA